MSDPKTERLIEAIDKSQILGPEGTLRLESLRTEIRKPDALADELVRREWITPFQAERLLNGEAEELVLGPYVLLEMLGEGGMGRVYKARHRLMNRIVALKVIRGDLLSSAEARLRFQREIEAAARVWHPNLVTALDASQIGTSFVLIMEYVEGTNLSTLLTTRGAPPIRHACDWVRQAALGLGHAHDQGLIHRDVKPSNLLLTAKGNVIKVMDLGLARLDLLGAPEPESPDAPLTESGVVIGTPDYMAPEQAIAPRLADARADIYSLGCTLYHLLTGRPPFPGGSLTQKLLWRQQSEPKDPARYRASLPPELSRLVLKMLAKDPGARPGSAADVAVELASFCSAAVLKTLPSSEPARQTEFEVEPFGSPSTPMVRHTPAPADPYELAEGPNEATVINVPTPVGLAKPAEAGDDSWWKDEVAQRQHEEAHAPTPTPRPAVHKIQREAPRSVEPKEHSVAEDPPRPRGHLYVIGLGFALVAIVAGLVIAIVSRM